MSTFRNALLALAAFGLATPCFADAGTVTTRIRVARPAVMTAAMTAQLKRRIGQAALEACGASGFSLAEVKRAVAASDCWHQAYADAIAGIDGIGVAHADASFKSRSNQGRP